MIKIRHLRQEDEKLLTIFFVNLSERDKSYFYPHPLNRENAVILCDSARAENNIRLVAVKKFQNSEEIVGYVYLRCCDDNKNKCTFGIVVREDCRGGLGNRLIEEIIQEAKAMNNLCSIELNVHKNNSRAIYLYQKHGFEIVKEFMKEMSVLFAEKKKLQIILKVKSKLLILRNLNLQTN